MLDRYVALLEAIVAAGEPVSAAELSRLTELPRPTCYRLVAALERSGLLESEGADGRYVLGMRFVRIALLGKSDLNVRRAVSGLLEHMVLRLGETGFFSRFRGGRVDLIHVETPKDPKTAYVYPGMGVRPAHACSSAKAIAAYAPPDILEALLSNSPAQFTERTLVAREDIFADLDQTRARGYAVCDGEMDDGVVSVAVPVEVDRLGAVFSLGVVGPSQRFHDRQLPSLIPALKEAAARASAAIQHCAILEADVMNEA